MTNAIRPSRRRLLELVAATAAGTLLTGTVARAQGSPLNVAYAGSMASLVEGPLKAAAAQAGFTIAGKPGGSTGLARQIVAGALRPDVFVPVTASPMRILFDAQKATRAVSIGHTEMVIAYSPRSTFTAAFDAAAKGAGQPWYQVLMQPGIRFGRTDPNVDPQGQNIIFTLQLAAQFYHQPDLVQKVLGPVDNPQQIFEEATVQSRLQSGQLDAASAYKVQPAPLGIPYVALPPQIDLGDATFAAQYAQASLQLGGKTLHPEALVYYAAALTDAPSGAQAAAFVTWLTGPQAQGIFKAHFYDPPGNAPPLVAG